MFWQVFPVKRPFNGTLGKYLTACKHGYWKPCKHAGQLQGCNLTTSLGQVMNQQQQQNNAILQQSANTVQAIQQVAENARSGNMATPRSDLAVLAKELETTPLFGWERLRRPWHMAIPGRTILSYSRANLRHQQSAPSRPPAQGPSCQLVQRYDAAQPYHSDMGRVCIRNHQDVHAHWPRTEGQATAW